MPGRLRETEFVAGFGRWCLASAPPDPDLAGQVVEYWEVQGALQPFRETLLPSGVAELMVNLGPAHELHSEQGQGRWTDAWFSGVQERSLIIESREGTHLVSARLHPLGAVTLLGEAAGGSVNRVLPFSALGIEVEPLRNNLRAASGPAERFVLLEHYLRAVRERRGQEVPALIWWAAARVEATHGNLKVSELHHEAHVSRRHLSVTFARYLGLSLKRYAAVRRFAWALYELRGRETVDWAQLAEQAGYSDQSHLVRDFRRVGAATPTEYLRRATPDGTALIDDER